MKITINQLRRIIKEEISRTLMENQKIQLPEDPKDLEAVLSNGLKSPYLMYRDLVSVYERANQIPDFIEVFEDLLANWDKSLSGSFERYVRDKMKEGLNAKTLGHARDLVYLVKHRDRLPMHGVVVSSFDDVVKVVELNKEFGEETEQMKQNAAMARQVYSRDARGRIIGRAD